MFLYNHKLKKIVCVKIIIVKKNYHGYLNAFISLSEFDLHVL